MNLSSVNVCRVLLASVSGYLIGSISFARIVMRVVAPGREYRQMQRKAADGDDP